MKQHPVWATSGRIRGIAGAAGASAAASAVAGSSAQQGATPFGYTSRRSSLWRRRDRKATRTVWIRRMGSLSASFPSDSAHAGQGKKDPTGVSQDKRAKGSHWSLGQRVAGAAGWVRGVHFCVVACRTGGMHTYFVGLMVGGARPRVRSRRGRGEQSATR
eukprot:2492630-Prymnesium_polylepis.1